MNRRGPIIVAIAGVLLIVLTVAGLILPKAGQIKDTQDKVAKAQAQEQSLQTQLDTLKGYQAQASQLRKQLEKYGVEVPPSADLPGLIRDLQQAANQSAVTLQTIAPGQPATASSPNVSIIPLQITVQGGFFAADEFLYRVQNMTRTSAVLQIALTPTTTSSDSGSSSSSSDTSSSTQFPFTAPTLSAVISANFYTTDISSGPGSQPGSQEAQSGTGSGTAGTSGGSASPPPASGGSSSTSSS
ncbi:MAG TPA: type 4a pilus biogenesis protein PilO [Actinomycetota bacterium]|jgi:Tfp pilus assembly protein PilO